MTRWRLVWEFDWPDDNKEPARACFQVSYVDPAVTRCAPHRFSVGKPLTGPTLGSVRLEKDKS